MNILQSFRDAALRASVALIPSDAEVILRDTDQPELGNHPTIKARLSVFAAKIAALIAVDATTSGIILTKRATFAETASGVSHVATIPVPAGAIIHSIKVVPRVLWGATTSATLKVGDTADDDGFFTGVNLKATDLLVGEVLDSQHSTLWGGKEGAYLVSATGRRGPTASNFGQSYVAGSNITGTITVVDPVAVTGRTDLVVEFSIPTTITPVVS
jgi:hypothetical protein